MAILPRNERLLTWLRHADDATLCDVGVSASYLRLIAYGHKRPSAKAAALIERATEGYVSRQSLRQDDWKLIWLELA